MLILEPEPTNSSSNCYSQVPSAASVNLDHEAQEAACGVPKTWWGDTLAAWGDREWGGTLGSETLGKVQIVKTARATGSVLEEEPH